MDDGTKDLDFVERMRENSNQQLVTLCKMHLAFEIDLELESASDRAKPKLWNKFHKKPKVCSPLTQVNLNQFDKLIHFLHKTENITQEGIFRKTGSVARQNELKAALLENVDLDLNRANYTAHDVASVLKTFLSELEEPLVTLAYFSAFQQVADLYNSKANCSMRDDRLLNSLQLLFILIPRENRSLLQQIIRLLHATIKFEDKNKMNADNLSTLFTPHLICPRNVS